MTNDLILWLFPLVLPWSSHIWFLRRAAQYWKKNWHCDIFWFSARYMTTKQKKNKKQNKTGTFTSNDSTMTGVIFPKWNSQSRACLVWWIDLNCSCVCMEPDTVVLIHLKAQTESKCSTLKPQKTQAQTAQNFNGCRGVFKKVCFQKTIKIKTFWHKQYNLTCDSPLTKDVCLWPGLLWRICF